MNEIWQKLWPTWWPVLSLLILLLALMLPISGEVHFLPGNEWQEGPWPQIWLEESDEGTTIIHLRDSEPWPNVLLTVNQKAANWGGYRGNPDGTWNWQWYYPTSSEHLTIAFYHDCDTGCILRGQLELGADEPPSREPLVPTKLGVVFPDPARDWHGRSGWGVTLTYADLASSEHWGIDDLAIRVEQAKAAGLRVLVRVDYAPGQSVPPTGDNVALDLYLRYLSRLARDERLGDVYGYLIGSGYNGLGSNAQAPDNPVTPSWYARLFNGAASPLHHTDNVVQTIRAVNSQVRVLVGPVQPWNIEQNGGQRYQVDMPWLNYFNTLVAALDESAQAKASAGIPFTAPDGFALHVPGRPNAPELAGRDSADEPALSLRRHKWKRAQVGFSIYKEWLEIINSYPSTTGLPAYITSTNTFTPDEGISPAQNYPRGWLTTALQTINQEPQIHALCWFLDADSSGDKRW
jgi:hypothetical protein